MINSLTLSSDMKTLYLIDNGRCIDFPLDTKRGVIIGTLLGQVTVVSAIEPVADNAVKAVGLTRLPVDGNVWTLAYLPKQQASAVIGATEIDFSLSSGSGGSSPKPQVQLFDLSGGKVLRLRRVGDFLELESIVAPVK